MKVVACANGFSSATGGAKREVKSENAIVPVDFNCDKLEFMDVTVDLTASDCENSFVIYKSKNKVLLFTCVVCFDMFVNPVEIELPNRSNVLSSVSIKSPSSIAASPSTLSFIVSGSSTPSGCLRPSTSARSFSSFSKSGSSVLYTSEAVVSICLVILEASVGIRRGRIPDEIVESADQPHDAKLSSGDVEGFAGVESVGGGLSVAGGETGLAVESVAGGETGLAVESAEGGILESLESSAIVVLSSRIDRKRMMLIDLVRFFKSHISAYLWHFSLCRSL
jgi:hypothetical protein